MLPRSHPDRIQIAFDDHRLVANAGLTLPATLARRLGLPQLADRCLDLGCAPGRANTGDKLMTLVASALDNAGIQGWRGRFVAIISFLHTPVSPPPRQPWGPAALVSSPCSRQGLTPGNYGPADHPLSANRFCRRPCPPRSLRGIRWDWPTGYCPLQSDQ